MKFQWLHKSGQSSLLVFCNGWGMDGRPFAPLQSHAMDVLMLYDYKNLECEVALLAVVESYRDAYLVGWSMGVWSGQRLFSALADRFRRKIAINGTLCPINDDLGIPYAIFAATMAGYSEEVRMRFYRRMCRERSDLERFLSHQPQRQLDDQRSELEDLLKQKECMENEASIYSDIVISDKDMIMPTANQKRFWEGRTTFMIRGHHFPFYGWKSWDELIQYPDVHRNHAG